MNSFIRRAVTGVLLMLGAVTGVVLVASAHAGPARAATCTPGPVTDPMGVTVDPSSDVQAWTRLTATFSGVISDGHCAGDSFSFTIPPSLHAQDGASYPLTAPDGSIVAMMVVHGGTVTVTLTDYVETHTGVTMSGWLSAQINDSTAPGGTDDLSWTVNGRTSTTPVQMGQCPDCSAMPTAPSKWGSVRADGGSLGIVVQVPTSTTDHQQYTFTDTLTSPGQRFVCPVAARSTIFTSQNEWGTPVGQAAGPPVTVTSCSNTSITGSITLGATGTAARVSFPVQVTNSSLTSWTDSATTTTNGRQQSTTTKVETWAGGGQGGGVQNQGPSSSPATSSTPAGSTPAGSTGAVSSAVVTPTAVDAGGTPGPERSGSARALGSTLLGASAVGLLALAATRSRRRGRHRV